MTWLVLLLTHLLFLYVIGFIPLLHTLEHFGIMRIPRITPLSRFYGASLAEKWASVLLLGWLAFLLGWTPQTLGLQFPTNIVGPAITLSILLLLLVGSTLILRWERRNPQRTAVMQQLVAQGLPSTKYERMLYTLIAITVGICEEVLFRGFFPAYLRMLFPGFPLILALLLSALFFGINHLQLKWASVVGGTILGLVFGCFYLWSGSLLFAIILHIVFDLRYLLLNFAELQQTPEPTQADHSGLSS